MRIGATKPATPVAVAYSSDEHGRESVVDDDANSDETGEDARIPTGTIVAERYRIARVLGEGGMGVVYAAEHVLMRKEVAIKVLHADMCSIPEVVARFEREAIAAAHIDHPNVAGATDFGRLPDGSCYLVLELLKGSRLRDEIAKGPIPLGRALHILRGIAAGVSAAHVKGIVHRDLKPENVMLVERDGDTDFIKVLDFGIAKVDTSVAAAPQADGVVLTRVGSVFGTPEYMAPEQAVGDTVDARADLYAIGVMFLEMITGKCPYSGNALSVLRERILSVGPPDMSAVADADARDLISRLLTRQVEDRMQSAAELLEAIDALGDRKGKSAPQRPSNFEMRGATVTTNPVVASLPAPPAPRPRWVVPAAAVALMTVALSSFGLVRALEKSKTDRLQNSTTKSFDTVDTATRAVVLPESAGAGSDSVATKNAEAATTETPPQPSAPSTTALVDEKPIVTPPAAKSAAAKTPAPTTSAASARSKTKAKPTTKRAPKSPPKKTGPGGIYVPPPKDWFK